jgi:hypothetical protein
VIAQLAKDFGPEDAHVPVLQSVGIGSGDAEMFSVKIHEQSLVADSAGESKLNCA